MDKKNKIYIIVFCLVLFAAVVAGLSFAYIKKTELSNTVTVNGTVNTTIPHTWSFADTTDKDISLEFVPDDFLYENVGSYKSYTYSTWLSLSSTKNTSLLCTYDVVYKATKQYVPTDANTLEFTIQGTSSRSETLTEQSIPTVYDGASNVLGTFTAAASGSTKITWNFEIRFYNINANQVNVYNSNPSGSIYFVERHCGD